MPNRKSNFDEPDMSAATRYAQNMHLGTHNNNNRHARESPLLMDMKNANHLEPNNNNSTPVRDMFDAGAQAAMSASPAVDANPLKLFVRAKRRVNEIFVDIQKLANETHDFLQTTYGETTLVSSEDIQCTEKQLGRVAAIAAVLARDKMKVVFFGRTSNGKSTTINAMLRDKILPSGIGHTTNCFLQVEGCESDDAHATVENSDEKLNIASVTQLTHALSSKHLAENTLVHVFWPKNKCFLLRNDVVLVDSPGIDVTPDLDEWIDKHCLDADLFVLVLNAESTLMQTEKNFFYKVSERLSKPNVFILNNRWDASAGETEFMDEVRAQHLERCVNFLANELKVASEAEAKERVFFVSAKEALLAHQKLAQGLPAISAALGQGFQQRFADFEIFERHFQECLSKSAVKTKFENHAGQGIDIIADMQRVLERICQIATEHKTLKEDLLQQRTKELRTQRASFEKLVNESGQQIQLVVTQSRNKVVKSFQYEIKRLHLIVDEFDHHDAVQFSIDPQGMQYFKLELYKFIEDGLMRNLMARCSTDILRTVDDLEQHMNTQISQMLPDDTENTTTSNDYHQEMQRILVSRRRFQPFYKLNLPGLCADFREDLRFRFSLSPTSLAQKFLPPKHAGHFVEEAVVVPRPMPTATVDDTAVAEQHRLQHSQTPPSGMVLQKPGSSSSSNTNQSRSPSLNRSISEGSGLRNRQGANKPNPVQVGVDADGCLYATGFSTQQLLSTVNLDTYDMFALLSKASVGSAAIAGLAWKTIGWRLLAILSAAYGMVYAYERFTWTVKAKEKEFKRQFVRHAAAKLQLVVDFTANHCQQQVEQELSETFTQLTHLINVSRKDLEEEIRRLDREITALDSSTTAARELRAQAMRVRQQFANFRREYIEMES